MTRSIPWRGTYVLLDTQDNLLLGNNETETGPKEYDDLMVARLAQEVATKTLGWPWGRIRVVKYKGGSNKKRDEVEFKMSPEQALKELEEGR